MTKKEVLLCEIDEETGYLLGGSPIVHCKDCKCSSDVYKTNGGVWKTDDRHLFCKLTNHLMRVDDFCSWGERRDEEND